MTLLTKTVVLESVWKGLLGPGIFSSEKYCVAPIAVHHIGDDGESSIAVEDHCEGFFPIPFHEPKLLSFAKASEIGWNPVIMDSVSGLDDWIHSLHIELPSMSQVSSG